MLTKQQLGQPGVFPSHTTPGLCLLAERALCKCENRFLESKDMAFGNQTDIGSRGGALVSSVSASKLLTRPAFGFTLWKMGINYIPKGVF